MLFFLPHFLLFFNILFFFFIHPFFKFNPQSFSITLYCADICLYICRLNKKKRSTFRTFHVEWSVTELLEWERKWGSMRQNRAVCIVGGVEYENKIKRIRKSEKMFFDEFIFFSFFCVLYVVCLNSHHKYLYIYIYIHICCSQFDLDFSCIEIDIIDMMKKMKKNIHV